MDHVQRQLNKRKYKLFRDNVHNYIKVPLEYVELFIDTEIFQRLRTIEQTGMRILYPSARHDRFVHSLGVYHLGAKAFKCFRNNAFGHLSDEEFWNRCQILFEIACLLHDCGHSPFSHTLEYIYDIQPVKEPVRARLDEKIKEHLISEEFNKDFIGEKINPHERMSALIVCTEFKNNINKLLKEYGLDKTEKENAVEFISRMIIGCPYKYGGDETENKKIGIKNCLISLLNSSSIDVDSLDYIIRDTKMSGIDNMNIDVDRLLESLTLVEITEVEKSVNLVNKSIKTTIFNGTLSGNEANLKGKICGELKMPQKSKLFQAILNGSIYVDGNLQIKEGSMWNDRYSYMNVITINGTPYLSDFCLKEMHTMHLQCVTKGDFTIKGSSASFLPTTNAKVKIDAEEIQFVSTYVDGKLSGSFKGKLLGDYSKILPGSVVKYELGFYKSSLSVIENVLIARNHEYEWVYSHHKVAYYANYLLIEVFKNCLRFLICKENPNVTDEEIHASDNMADILNWETMVDVKKELYGFCFWRPTDADVLSFFKSCQILADKNTNQRNAPELLELMRQLNHRKYRKSLWKSYAEMCNFFSEFTQHDVDSLFDILVVNSTRRLNKQYGYLDGIWKEKFKECGLDDVVWVNGYSKLKTLNANETFIRFDDGRVMTYALVGTNRISVPSKANVLFYIYYTPINNEGVDKDKLNSFLHQEIAESYERES